MPDRVSHVVGVEPAGQNEAPSLRRPSARRQSKTLPEPGRGGVDEHDVGPVLGGPAETFVAGREGLYDKGYPDRDVPAVLEATPCPCSWAASRPAWLTISTTRCGSSSRKTPTVQISGEGAG